MMQNLGFAHYNLRADRLLLEELREFYEIAVGLAIGPRPAITSFGYWLYAAGKDVLHLSEQGETEHRKTGSDLTFDHVAFHCVGVQAFEQRLADRGVTYRRMVLPGAGNVQLFLRDPAGNGVELNFSG